MEKNMLAKGIKDNLQFPKKMLFNNFSAVKIEERKQKIENYLNRLSELLNLIEYPEACEFMEIQAHTRTLLSSLEFEIRGDSSLSPKMDPLTEDLEDTFLLSGRKEASTVNEFLKKLNNAPLMIAKSVQEFEEYYYDKSLILSKEEIKQLLWGNSKLKGLLYFCGDTQKYIGSSSCIQLFAKFLKYEYNSVEADKYLEVFSMTHPDLIRQMHLDYYIKEITTLDNSGLLSLYYYLKDNTHNISEPEEILQDQKSIEEYKKWIQNKLTFGNV